MPFPRSPRVAEPLEVFSVHETSCLDPGEREKSPPGTRSALLITCGSCKVTLGSKESPHCITSLWSICAPRGGGGGWRKERERETHTRVAGGGRRGWWEAASEGSLLWP